jgi:serine/threonine protein kinase
MEIASGSGARSPPWCFCLIAVEADFVSHISNADGLMDSNQQSGRPENATRHTTEPAGPPLPLYGMEDANIPRQIGKFKILDLLARGMALVYKAEQENPHRIVALKMPRGGRLLSPEVRQRFLREVGLAARVEHSGIVPVLEAGEIEGTPYYTMPFIEGRSLNEVVSVEEPGFERRLDVFLRVCGVVQALHAQGLVHRDLKPENIMIDRHGDVRLLDFGLAKALAEKDDHLSSSEALLGTLQFMAPEQTRPGAKDQIIPATDVYSLGVILYWLLTDSFPYHVSGPRDAALETIRNLAVEPPSRRKAALSPNLDAVILACLAKEPHSRPQNAEELADQLRAAMKGHAAPSPKQAFPSGRGFFSWLLIGLGAIALLVGLGVALRQHRPAAGVDSTPLIKTSPPLISGNQSEPPSIQVYSMSEISGLAQGHNPPQFNGPVPAELWPIYEKALASLHEEFAHHQQGAVLLHLPRSLRNTSAATVTWSLGGEITRHEQAIEPGGAAVLYLPANQQCQLEVMSAGNVSRQSLSAAAGEVSYRALSHR